MNTLYWLCGFGDSPAPFPGATFSPLSKFQVRRSTIGVQDCSELFVVPTMEIKLNRLGVGFDCGGDASRFEGLIALLFLLHHLFALLFHLLFALGSGDSFIKGHRLFDVRHLLPILANRSVHGRHADM